jgi:hypothetical protein
VRRREAAPGHDSNDSWIGIKRVGTTFGSQAMKIDEMIASFQTIITLAQNALRTSTTADWRDEELRLIEAEAARSLTRLLSAVVLG